MVLHHVRTVLFFSTGIKANRFITSHGIALNCNNNLEWFKHIDPCGIKDKGVTSLTSELQEEVTVQQTIPHFLEAFEEKFGCEIVDSLLEASEHGLLPMHENIEKVVEHISKAEGQKAQDSV